MRLISGGRVIFALAASSTLNLHYANKHVTNQRCERPWRCPRLSRCHTTQVPPGKPCRSRCIGVTPIWAPAKPPHASCTVRSSWHAWWPPCTPLCKDRTAEREKRTRKVISSSSPPTTTIIVFVVVFSVTAVAVITFLTLFFLLFFFFLPTLVPHVSLVGSLSSVWVEVINKRSVWPTCPISSSSSSIP